MTCSITVLCVFILIYIANCRDFYVGMFKKNDLLVAQDRLYKDRAPYGYMYAKYGRLFKCKISYFRVVDRLGFGPGPRAQIVRGGLKHNYLVLRLTSPYNMPISVNIYVGCPNVKNDTTTTSAASATSTTVASTSGNVTEASEATASDKATEESAATNGTSASPDVTTPDTERNDGDEVTEAS